MAGGQEQEKQWQKGREDGAGEEPNRSNWDLKSKAEEEHWILGPGGGKNWHQNQQLYFSTKASLGDVETGPHSGAEMYTPAHEEQVTSSTKSCTTP